MVSLPIPVPPHAHILVQVADTVAPGQLLAQTPESATYRIPLAQMLHVPVQKVSSFLRVQSGDSVTEGDVLVVRKNMFGLTIARMKSNISGQVLRFEEDSGTLVIGDPEQKKIEVFSPIAGVVQVCHNDEIVLQTNENILSGVGGTGGTAQGKLHIVTSTNPAAVLAELNGSIIDSIVAAQQFDRDSLIKAIGIGAAGIISVAVDPEDMTYLQQKNLIVPIVLVTKDMFKTLTKRTGKEVFIEGRTYTILLFV